MGVCVCVYFKERTFVHYNVWIGKRKAGWLTSRKRENECVWEWYQKHCCSSGNYCSLVRVLKIYRLQEGYSNSTIIAGTGIKLTICNLNRLSAVPIRNWIIRAGVGPEEINLQLPSSASPDHLSFTLSPSCLLSLYLSFSPSAFLPSITYNPNYFFVCDFILFPPLIHLLTSVLPVFFTLV